jgi:nucleoside-diphosphate-sugar epimerase
MIETILILGAGGQIGSELTNLYNLKYGLDNVILCDLKPIICNQKSYEIDVLDLEKLEVIFSNYRPSIVFHLPAVLSAKGESIPQKAWNINMQGLLNVLELSKKYEVKKIFYPSSIAVFGNSTPKQSVAQHTINEPNTVYGISKFAGEMWVQYYHEKYNMDIRGLRFPGVISYQTQPGGGTTDYAVDIFYHAVQGKKYTCFLNENTMLPMMYMPDALQAVEQLMDANSEQILTRTAYNIHSMSFTPKQLFEAIRKHLPDFEIEYQPDSRQNIAHTWVHSLDDSCARSEWGWAPKYDIDRMVADILPNLKLKLNS